LISESDWQYLLRHRPRFGWPLSTVTALELLVGLDGLPPQRFVSLRKQIEFAWETSRGRILEEPRFLLCRDILRIPFPSHLGRLSPMVLIRYLNTVRRAASLTEILQCRVPYTRGRRAGFDSTSVINDLVSGPKAEWTAIVQKIADDVYPRWRDQLKETGKRLPLDMRKHLELPSTWEPERDRLAASALQWLGVSTTPELIAQIRGKLDAVIEFSIFVSREFLTGNYSLEKNHSDIYDQFQLHHLAVDRFVIVSNDANMAKRISPSKQRDRVVSFERFLKSL
jgi:hypothetical protein